MSSKLVKKLLQRALTADVDLGNAMTTPASTLKKNELSVKMSGFSRREDTSVQDQINRILSLDAAVSRYASLTVRKSFDRRSDDIKLERKRRRDATGGAGKGITAALSNSRGTASAIAQKPHERRYDKQTDKQQREEGYFEDIARALKKGRKGELKEKKVKKMRSR